MELWTGSLQESPIGPVSVTATEQGVTRIAFESCADTGGCNRLIEQALGQISEYFAGRRFTFSLPLDVRGTRFQKRVWAVLDTIPFGETRTYGDIAAHLGNHRLARAVGRANATNPVPIVRPCHRVIGADGTLTGFGGGLEKKAALLHLERAQAIPQMFAQ